MLSLKYHYPDNGPQIGILDYLAGSMMSQVYAEVRYDSFISKRQFQYLGMESGIDIIASGQSSQM